MHMLCSDTLHEIVIKESIFRTNNSNGLRVNKSHIFSEGTNQNLHTTVRCNRKGSKTGRSRGLSAGPELVPGHASGRARGALGLHRYRFVVTPTEGMEIGRYFYGSFQGFPKHAHMHQADALKLIQGLTIGRILDPQRKALFRMMSHADAGDNGDDEGEVDLEKTSWKLVGRKAISASHAMLQFEAKDVTVGVLLPYFDHCGKYYKVRRCTTMWSRRFTQSRSTCRGTTRAHLR